MAGSVSGGRVALHAGTQRVLYVAVGGWLAFFPLTGIITLTLSARHHVHHPRSS